MIAVVLLLPMRRTKVTQLVGESVPDKHYRGTASADKFSRRATLESNANILAISSFSQYGSNG